MAYRIDIQPVARRQAKRLPPEAKSGIDAAIHRLADDPRPPGCKSVVSLPSGYRIRLGDYRVIYTVDDQGEIVAVLRIAWRDKAYKGLRLLGS